MNVCGKRSAGTMTTNRYHTYSADRVQRIVSSLCLTLLGVFSVVLSGCSTYWLNAPPGWEFMSQLQSVPISEPHGTLVVQRNDHHIYVVINGVAVFKTLKGNSAAFYMAPGEYEVKSKYLLSAYPNTTSSRILTSTVIIEEGKETKITIMAESYVIHMSVGLPGISDTAVEVQKVPEDPREKTLGAAKKAGLHVMIDADGKVELKRTATISDEE